MSIFEPAVSYSFLSPLLFLNNITSRIRYFKYITYTYIAFPINICAIKGRIVSITSLQKKDNYKSVPVISKAYD